MSRTYKCPHCGAVQKAEPAPDHKVQVLCDQCGGRFRIPALQEKARLQTSVGHAAVREQIKAAADAMRSEDDKQKLQRIVDERRLGDYDILDELGRGGMGVVFKAFHRHLKRMVALKVILPDADDPETMLRRFKREAELHARLSHPNIVHVYDYGAIDGMHYFAMDFITGTQLTKIIGSPEFRLIQRLQVIQAVAEGLEHAHGQGVVHRDIKPDNIIVDAGWSPHVVDFGIAKATDTAGQENITRQGLAVGTPHYMAPEQFRPKLGPVGPGSDVYAVGAVLYHLLSGRTPFDADTAHQVLIRAATQEAAPIENTKTPSDEVIDKDLAAIVKRAMLKEPAKRYASAKDLAADIGRYLAGEEVEANPLSGKERLRRRMVKNRDIVRLFSMTAGILFTVLVTFIVVTASFRSRESDAAAKIQAAETALKGGNEAAALTALNGTATDLESGGTGLLLTGFGVMAAAAVVMLGLGYRLVRAPEKKVLVVAPTTRPDEIGQTADEVAVR